MAQNPLLAFVKNSVRLMLQKGKIMRFTVFILALVVFTLILLYVIGDRRQPSQKMIEQEVELQAR